MSEDIQQADYAAIKGHMARGALWMVAMRWSLRFVGFVNILILARLLSPNDFGVMTMAWIVVEFLMMLSETSADIAVLRSNKFTRDYLDTAWTVKIISAGLTAAALIAIAPLTTFYYHDDRIPLVIQIVAIRALIMGFENIGIVEFRHSLQFNKEYHYWIARRLIMLGVTWGLVFVMRDYMALAISAPISAVVTVALSFYMSKYRPRLCLERWHEMWSFSQWQILYNTSRFVNGRIDQFVIGGIGKATDIGNYYVASDIATTPGREIIWPMGRAFTPAFAKLMHDEGELRKAFAGILGFAALISFSSGFGMSAIADDAVVVLLGDQWTESAEFFRWLAICGVFEGFLYTMESYFIARKHERTFALVNFGQLMLLAPVLFYIGREHGLEAIAATRMAVMAVTIVLLFAVMARLKWLSLSEALLALWRPAVAAAAMMALVRWAHDPAPTYRVLSLMQDIGVGVAAFAFALYGLWLVSGRPDGPERTILTTIKRKGGKWFAR